VLFQWRWQQFCFWKLPEPVSRLRSEQQGALLPCFSKYFKLTQYFQSDVCVEASTQSTKKKPLSKISKFPGRSRSGSADVTITGTFSTQCILVTKLTFIPFLDFERKCTQIVWNPANQEIAVACQNNVLVYAGTPA
jgi:hypothetical protein